MNRPTWEEYFVSIAKLTSERSNCIRRKVGCIIVKDNRILSLGYNGTAKGTKNCYDGGCIRCNEKNIISGMNLDNCLCIHAEENAMLFISLQKMKGSTLYVNVMPCLNCAKKIVQCEIKKIVYCEKYIENDKYTINFFEENNVNLHFFKD